MAIGTLGEMSLHAALKEWYGRSHDRFEAEVDGYVIDIVRGRRLIEIQTRHLYAMRPKLKRLLPDYTLHIIHPIHREKWIIRQGKDGQAISRRKSPKRGQIADIFYELVRIHAWLDHPNLTVEAVLTQEEEILRDDGAGSWRRRGWSVHDRRLLAVLDRQQFDSLADYCAILPTELPELFTNSDLAAALGCRANLAQKITYTLRHIGGLEMAGKQGRAHLYRRVLPSLA
jgi:hypothetical protein